MRDGLAHDYRLSYVKPDKFSLQTLLVKTILFSQGKGYTEVHRGSPIVELPYTISKLQ